MLIDDLAVDRGVSAKTIRYHESVGLLPPLGRMANGYRVYGTPDVGRLRFIAAARALGFSPGDIKEVWGTG